MTREEARERLNNIKWNHATNPCPDREALDMAIKALDQEPCCNCIEFKRYAKEMGFEIEQEPRWIPVSERLPKEDGRYLVTVQNLTGYEYLDNNVFECEFFHTDWIFKGWKDNKVIAWMPKPKPYKAESEE